MPVATVRLDCLEHCAQFRLHTGSCCAATTFSDRPRSASSAPTRSSPCGVANFSAAPVRGARAPTAPRSASCGSPTSHRLRTTGSSESSSAGRRSPVAACAATLNNSDVAVIQLRPPRLRRCRRRRGARRRRGVAGSRRSSSSTTFSKTPRHISVGCSRRSSAKADRVVVMSEAARQRLCGGYAVDSRKVVTIPHGATIPTGARAKRASRPTLLTWGLLRPGKGIERVIDAMVSLQDRGRPAALPGGGPDAPEGRRPPTARRTATRSSSGRRTPGWRIAVTIDARHYDTAMLTSLIQSASLIVLPYDSTDQVTSGVLVDAVASGRPVVATAFPHAVELLSGGAGIVRRPRRSGCAGARRCARF